MLACVVCIGAIWQQQGKSGEGSRPDLPAPRVPPCSDDACDVLTNVGDGDALVPVVQCAKPIEELLSLHRDVVTLRGMPYAEDLTAPLPQVLDRIRHGGPLGSRKK